MGWDEESGVHLLGVVKGGGDTCVCVRVAGPLLACKLRLRLFFSDCCLLLRLFDVLEHFRFFIVFLGYIFVCLCMVSYVYGV